MENNNFNLKQFEIDILELLNQGYRYVILDFCHSFYMNTAGIGVLIKLMDTFEKAGGDIKLTNVPEKLITAFDALGLLTIFNIYEKIEALKEQPNTTVYQFPLQDTIDKSQNLIFKQHLNCLSNAQIKEINNKRYTVAKTPYFIDISNIHSFEDDINRLSQDSREIILDFYKTHHISSTGLGVLVRIVDQFQENGGNVKLIVPKNVLLLFAAFDLLNFFEIYNSLEDIS